jgi:hypothetical protein
MRHDHRGVALVFVFVITGEGCCEDEGRIHVLVDCISPRRRVDLYPDQRKRRLGSSMSEVGRAADQRQ